MERVVLTAIAFDAGTQIREAINESVVADYADRMTEGAQFPPVVLFHDGNRYYLADGFHRYMAAQRNGFVDIPADVQAGTKEDALWFALGANRNHGHRLSHADKRRAVEIALTQWPGRSAGSIAEHVGVDRGFVSDMRRRLDMVSSTPERVIGRDGKSYAAVGNGRVSADKASEVVAALKAGDGVSAIAERLSMSTRTVNKLREQAGIPQKLDRTRDGTQARREQMREMASAGYTSRQIASELGLSEQGCRATLREEGIDVPADAVAMKTRKHDAARIIEHIVIDAENLTADVHLIDFDALDGAQIAGWLKSLNDSRDKLGAFIRRLMKEQQKHGEAA